VKKAAGPIVAVEGLDVEPLHGPDHQGDKAAGSIVAVEGLHVKQFHGRDHQGLDVEHHHGRPAWMSFPRIAAELGVSCATVCRA
jgi:hypothetical protein